MNSYKFLIHILFTLGLTVCLWSCREDYDVVFEETPDERLRAALDAYNTQLINAPYGWKAILRTGTGAAYFYYFDFHEDGRVTMLSDFDEPSARYTMEGSWALKALQRPTLSFDTYSYIHLPADPNGAVNGGANGEGLISDFEFALGESAGDSLVLEGIRHGSRITITHATEDESAALLDQQLYSVVSGTKTYLSAHKGSYIRLSDSEEFPVILDMGSKMFGIQYLAEGGENIETSLVPFTFSTEGIRLDSALRFAGHTIRELLWDVDNERYTVRLDETTTEIVPLDAPFIFDLPVPLHQAFGDQYKFMLVPRLTGNVPLPGQSDDFIAAYQEAADAVLAGEYHLNLGEMYVELLPSSNHLILYVFFSQTVDGMTSVYFADFAYSYTLSETGVFDFFYVGAGQNGWVVINEFETILDYINDDTFKAQYVGGYPELLGGLFSQENPGFYFSGQLLTAFN